MDNLKKRILEDARVMDKDILKVDSFLNHQIDVKLLVEMGLELHRRFAGEPVTKILTIESSGISVACATAMNFHVPVIFAKKGSSRKSDDEVFSVNAYSYTKQEPYVMNVSRKYIGNKDHILIIDDFLANGEAALAMLEIVRMAGATLAGIGIVIEKAFQKGGKAIRDKGIRLETLVSIQSMENGRIIFRD
ncbi:MAG: xanthine phosphoribosyltransferase [Clostridia bacterium]